MNYKCPECGTQLEIVGRCGYCFNPDCIVHHLNFKTTIKTIGCEKE